MACVCAGDITSRLSADTTTASDQISLNINVTVRSITQAAMVLVFMFHASWRLTIITFIMVPAIIAICKVYGAYYKCGVPLFARPAILCCVAMVKWVIQQSLDAYHM